MNKLNEIFAYKKDLVEKQKTKISEHALQELIHDAEHPRGFADAIERKTLNQQTAIIAEIKKASPSKGIIRTDFDIVDIASAYAHGGATCLSILTDEKYFQGDNDYINMAKQHATLPALRKDFIFDPYQVIESRAIGADAILLIMAYLSDAQAAELEALAIELGMDVLVESHNEEELKRALQLQTKLIGINNRDLKTLEVDINTSKILAKNIPTDKIIICESGIENAAQIKEFNALGIYAFLIGETFMKADVIEAAVKELCHNS
jgi:indole-3-glycerol phosphate synthase